MNVNAEIADFGEHHLPQHSKFQSTLRIIVSFLSSFGCCSEQHLVTDLESEEDFEKSVTCRRFTPSSLGGSGDLPREANLLAYERVSRGLRLLNDNEPFGLKELILETGEVPIEDRVVLVRPEDEAPIGDLAPEGGHPVAVMQRYEPPPSLTPEQADFLRELVIPEPVLSRTVAAVLVAIDARLGVMVPNTESNLFVVEKMAKKIMKDVGFRDVDISRHLPQICECYFVCRENQELAGARRRRVPRWLLNLLGFRSNTTRLRA